MNSAQTPGGETESSKHIEAISSLEGSEEHRLEYIKTLVALLQDDARHVLLYVTVDFAVVLLFLSQIPIDRTLSLPLWARSVLAAGLVSMLFSALAFFMYVRRIHINRYALARCIPSVDAVRAREIVAGKAGLWQTHKRRYFAGLWLLRLGTTLLMTDIVYLFLFRPGIGLR